MKTNAEKQELQPVRDFRLMARAVKQYVGADILLQRLQLRITEKVNRASAGVSSVVVRTTEHLEESRRRVTDLALANPQWFEAKKTLVLPAGSVKVAQASHIEIKDEKYTLQKIKDFAKDQGEEAAKAARVDPAQLIRTKEEPAKKFLEELSDETLAALGCRRVQTTTVTVKTAGPKIGKAESAAAEDEGAATPEEPAEEGEA